MRLTNRGRCGTVPRLMSGATTNWRRSPPDGIIDVPRRWLTIGNRATRCGGLITNRYQQRRTTTVSIVEIGNYYGVHVLGHRQRDP